MHRLFVIPAILFAFQATAAKPPRMLFQHGETKDLGAAGGARTAYAIMRLPDGSFAFYDRYRPAKGPLNLPDADGRRHALLPHLPAKVLASEAIMNSGVLANTQVILGQDDEVKSVLVKNEALDKATAKKVGLPRYLNTWIRRTSLEQDHDQLMTWRGYNGSQMEYQQLKSGRLLVPHGSFLPHARAVPPTGRHETVIQYSDDGGKTWALSRSKLIAPCYPGFNGSNEGACEPSFEELKDGRIWMMMRTTAGFAYESISSDNGTTWSKARASRFNTSTGPPNIMRHQNGWLVVSWNNCEMPPRANGDGVYGGRDALHIAVSADEGKTWRGFREIYLDHRRNGNPAKSGDRGTAYPLGAYTADGNIVVIAGQGAGGRNPILIDPDWIIATNAATDFSDGLKQWSTYTHHGPAKRWWRARAEGARLVPHPDDLGYECLHLRKQPDLPADGATWNFPNGWKGEMSVHIRTLQGSSGGFISLNDRMFDPANDYGEEFAIFRISLDDLTLQPGIWTTVSLSWDLGRDTGAVSVNGRQVAALPVRHRTLNGLSYLRLRASNSDHTGFQIARASVEITDPFAPPATAIDQLAHEQRYVKSVVPTWTLDLP